jgi:hypothetical protein
MASQSVDAAWREIANDLARALRPYTLLRDMRVKDHRIVVETSVPGSTLRSAREALDSYRDASSPTLDHDDALAARTDSRCPLPAR